MLISSTQELRLLEEHQNTRLEYMLMDQRRELEILSFVMNGVPKTEALIDVQDELKAVYSLNLLTVAANAQFS